MTISSLLSGLLLTLFCGSAFASTQVFSPPTNDYWLAPSVSNRTLYGPTNPTGKWHITQWSTPAGNLPPFAPSGGYQVTSNWAQTVIVGGGAVSIKNVGWADATHWNPCGNEFDTFVEPNNATYPSHPSAAMGVSPNLKELKSLHHTLTVQLRLSVKHAGGCSTTQSIVMDSFILRNNTANQTLFWQIADYYSPNLTVTQFWFWKNVGGKWGFQEPITNWGKPYVRPGAGAVTYSIELLPRLKKIIVDGAASGLDQDLSHWQISSAYFGPVTWGAWMLYASFWGWSLTYVSR